jgi:zinc transport system substrate-binding protein
MWLRAIGGPHIEVTVLLPPGASLHVWQPAVAQMRALADADLRVIAGGGLEPWADQFLRATRHGQRDFVLVDELEREGVLPAPGEARPIFALGAVASEEHESSSVNPHVWTSPSLAWPLCRRLTEILAELDPEHRADFLARETIYQATLASLEAECAARRSLWEGKRIITFHAAWDHFARAVGLEIAGVIERAPGVDPGPREMRNLIDMIRNEHVDAIVAEPQFNDAVARRLAEVTSVPLAVLDPLGHPDESYEELIRSNLAALDSALGGLPARSAQPN